MAGSVSEQDESNPALIGYPSEQDGAFLAARGYPLYPRKPYYNSFINQACSVKTAGY